VLYKADAKEGGREGQTDGEREGGEAGREGKNPLNLQDKKQTSSS
jgi:hypothetical protein